jgi:hypothetical protein
MGVCVGLRVIASDEPKRVWGLGHLQRADVRPTQTVRPGPFVSGLGQDLHRGLARWPAHSGADASCRTHFFV